MTLTLNVHEQMFQMKTVPKIVRNPYLNVEVMVVRGICSPPEHAWKFLSSYINFIYIDIGIINFVRRSQNFIGGILT